MRIEKLYKIFSLITIIESLGVMLWLSMLPIDPKNVIFLGFSKWRLFFIGLPVLGICILVFTLILNRKESKFHLLFFQFLENSRFQYFCFLAGWTAWTVLIILSLNNKMVAVFQRFLPISLWAGVIPLQWLLLTKITQPGYGAQKRKWIVTGIRKFWKPALFTLGVLIAFYISSAILYPTHTSEDFWWEIGIPILVWQIIFSLLIGVIYHFLKDRIEQLLGRRKDLVIFLLLFLVFGFVWGSHKITPSYFNPGPFPPNQVYYPAYDAEKFDLQGQSSLIGFGLNNGKPLDRPFYPMFLAILHLFSGQDYTGNMHLQAFLFAVLPALIYLICAELNERTWGITSAIAIGFWGFNVISSNDLITTSTPIQMLTDFPLAIILSLVLLFTIRWLKDSSHSTKYALLVGASLSLAAYVRYSALSLLPLWLFIALIKYRRQFRKGLGIAAVILLGFLLFTLPWYARNMVSGQNASLPFSNKVLFVINTRYQPKEKELPDNKINEKNGKKQPAPSNDNSSWGLENLSGSENGDFGNNQFLEELSTEEKKSSGRNDLTKPFLNWFSAHFVHNVMSSILILPTTINITSLRDTLMATGSVWQKNWSGTLPLSGLILLMIQFLILIIGLIWLFRKNFYPALSIIFLFFGIHLSNSFGRTSGGRYVIPIIWVILLVYFAGFFKVLNFSETPEKSTEKSTSIPAKNRIMWAVIISIILIAGSIPILFERITYSVFAHSSNPLSFQEIINNPEMNYRDNEKSQMEAWMQNKKSRKLHGYVFYPITREASELKNLNLDTPLPVVQFTLIQETDIISVYFPFKETIDLENQDEVYILGCKSSKIYFAKDIFVLREGKFTHYHSDYVPKMCNFQ